ncbi:hypothetical protein EMCRGX_G032132 [Ephydatia muelleri]
MFDEEIFTGGLTTALFGLGLLGPIAHRGGTPENTLTAIRNSKASGASGIEVDLAFTKDGYPVILHDDTVDRTSNGKGNISDMTLEEARKLDFGIVFGHEFQNERIPTLQETVELCKELDLLMFLELKSDRKEALDALQMIFKDRELYSRIAVISFLPHLLYKVRKAHPMALMGYLLCPNLLVEWPDGSRDNRAWWKHVFNGVFDVLLYWSTHLWLWRLLEIDVFLPSKEDIMENRINPKWWHNLKIPLVTWTVNEAKVQVHFREGHICVDNTD